MFVGDGPIRSPELEFGLQSKGSQKSRTATQNKTDHKGKRRGACLHLSETF